MRYRCHVEVDLKPGLLDPQGKAVEGALPAMGWTNVSNVRIGKSISLDIEASDEQEAIAQVREMAERLLSNPVIELFVIRGVQENPGLALEDHP
ncbi:MAG TPA: phosphoribosylformylglycinamidine synthase subunit PurS [Actinomycetota bacterium]